MQSKRRKTKLGDHSAGTALSPEREIFSQFRMPGACLLGHCALRGHPLFNCPATIITLVRLHADPLGSTSRPCAAEMKRWLISTAVPPWHSRP